MKRRQANQALVGVVGGLMTSAAGLLDIPSWEKLWVDDLLAIYARGIAVCQNLLRSSPHQVEDILPLFCQETTLLAQQAGRLQRPAARLASQAQQLTCEIFADRNDFGRAQQAGQRALLYAQLAEDVNLQVASLIGLMDVVFDQHQSAAAPQRYEQQALSLLNEQVTPLLKGRLYAGIAYTSAWRGQVQETMRAIGLAYEHYPLKPQDDPAYPYLQAERYTLYDFADAFSRVLLGQPKEAEQAHLAMQREIDIAQLPPIRKVTFLHRQAQIHIQQGELEASSTFLTEAATLAKDLGSRLYFHEQALIYQQLRTQWPGEPLVVRLEEVFQPW